MAFLPRLFRREPESLKGIRERSAVLRSAELSSPAFPRPVSGKEARAALERSRARRAAANGGTA
jgi:hypothetical protein